jgi:hypothetical protein
MAASTCLATIGTLRTTQIAFTVFTTTAEPCQTGFPCQSRQPICSGSVTFLRHHGLHA